MLAKIYSAMMSMFCKKKIEWKAVLPERFVRGALVANIPNPSQQQAINRRLCAQLDAILAMVQNAH